HFNTLTHAVKRKKEPVRDTQHAPRVFVRSKKSDQSHVVIAFRGYPVTSAKSYAAMLLASILGGTMSSRLWQVVREKLGAAYYVRAGHEALTDHGVFEISAGLDRCQKRSCRAAKTLSSAASS
ncbi:MAG: Processing peptidase, partial [Parcubacteria group bacterium GW2011_GWA1_54_88]